MPEEVDIKFMQRCLELASKAEGMTYPNPLVGSVIVNNGRIIGEGYHLKAGGPHAEVMAVNSVTNRDLLGSSAIYVNLEPCSHYGKTPPCADMIIKHKIPKVIIGTTDTSEKISGRGIDRLRESGCEVITGVLKEECRRLNRRFFTFHEKNRPYITLKWAQSRDGFIDINRPYAQSGEPTWITGRPERILVHKWRAEEQAILAGAGTVRADNPRLNVREWEGNNPKIIILSGSGELDPDSAVLEKPGSVIFTYNKNMYFPGSEAVIMDENMRAAVSVSDYLRNNGIQSLLIEGGARVLEHFITTGYWDEARIFEGYAPFNDGVRAPEISGKLFLTKKFTQSTLRIILNPDR